MELLKERKSGVAADELVVLVHGTYASHESDEGDGWWQRGSQAWRDLRDRLPEGTVLPEQGKIFHWSGENGERARIKAARDLLEFLTAIEDEGKRYHLIGHSHGGSVIWHALRLATLRKRTLHGLSSWSTVGTPFLHHRTKGPWHVMSVIKVLLAILLIKPAVRTIGKLALLVGAALFGTDHGVTLPTDGSPGWIATQRGFPVKVLELCGVPVAETAEGLRVGTLDLSGGQTIVEYVFLTAEGWLIVAIALTATYIYLNLAKFCISPVLESFRIRAEKRLERKVMDTYQGRWLGLWSPDDEAINGLRATLNFSVSFVSELAPQDSVLVSDRMAFVSRPHHWIFATLYNRFCRPMLNRTVRSQVVKTAQGNNRPSAEVVAVSPAPVEVDEIPHLPDWLNAKLTSCADQHARDITPKLRRLLASPSIVSGLETFGHTLSGRELVHTSYFDHAEVLDLLAVHIATSCGKRATTECRDERIMQLKRWLRQFRSHFADPQESIVPDLVIPRRRTAA